jgi:hypothetical protein
VPHQIGFEFGHTREVGLPRLLIIVLSQGQACSKVLSSRIRITECSERFQLVAGINFFVGFLTDEGLARALQTSCFLNLSDGIVFQ